MTADAEQESWTCPVCGAITHIGPDIRAGYCAICRRVTVGARTLAQHMAWLESIGQEKGCPCRFQYKSLGRGHGEGWVRMNTDPACPAHGREAQRRQRGRRL